MMTPAPVHVNPINWEDYPDRTRVFFTVHAQFEDDSVKIISVTNNLDYAIDYANMNSRVPVIKSLVVNCADFGPEFAGANPQEVFELFR